MNSRSKNFARRGAFVLTLGAAAVAALVPDWCVALKAQYYDSGVDLSLDLLPPAQGLVAGQDADFLLTTSNKGPGDAVRPRVLAYLQGDAQPGATSGCADDPIGYPLCLLTAPALSGGSADYLLNTHLPPTARGEVQIIAVAMSDDTDNQPGNELVIYHAPIRVAAEVSATASCYESHVMMHQPVTCQFRFHNDGPSSSNAQVNATMYAAYSTTWTCAATRAESCPASMPANWSASFYLRDLLPGEELVLTATAAPDGTFTQDEGVRYSAFLWMSTDEGDGDASNNLSEGIVPMSLFYNGFDN